MTSKLKGQLQLKPPRKVPTKIDYYMGLALVVAARSKDPDTQCGCVILDQSWEPISIGYNGTPKSMDDNEIDWSRPEKYPYIIHSEINAIRYAKRDLDGCVLIVTAMPCSVCMLDIVSNGISTVVYRDIKPKDGSSMLANKKGWELSKDIAKRGGVILVEFDGDLGWVKNV